MVRMITQILAGLMLFFGAVTLFPKSYFEFKAGRKAKGIKYIVLGALASFFSVMAFGMAYYVFNNEVLR
ncbi:MAG: hypothetical protein HZB33_03290 [Nitrospirae bacterium]|nr:hypothetical protein [Nitrospirota bacterium]